MGSWIGLGLGVWGRVGLGLAFGFAFGLELGVGLELGLRLGLGLGLLRPAALDQLEVALRRQRRALLLDDGLGELRKGRTVLGLLVGVKAGLVVE